jgi:anti-sigma regulatory factor (Ser/Thr protein kinase)
VATRCGGSPAEAFDFTCCPETISRGRRFIESWAKHGGFDDHDRGLIVLGCDEVMSNIVKHVFRPETGRATGEGPVRCRVRIEDGALKIRIEHGGTGISHEEFARHRDEIPTPGERPGGLGIHVIDEVFDSVHCFAGKPEKGEPAFVELSKTLQDRRQEI